MALKMTSEHRRGRPRGTTTDKLVVAAIEAAGLGIPRGERAPPLKFLNAKDVCESTRLSRAQVYRMVGAGLFPKPIAISVGRRVWIEAEVSAWMEEQARWARL